MPKNDTAFLPEAELRTQIKSKQFAPCYVLFGEENYLIKRHLNSILSAVDSFPEFNITQFDSAVKAQSVYDAVSSLPMMSDCKVVTLCDFPFDKVSAAEAEKIYSAIKDIPSSTVLVIWFETVEISAKKPGEKFSKLFKSVREVGGEVCYLGRKSTAEIIKLLQSGATRRHCHMDSSVARYMIETCSDDLNTLVNELEKLCFYVGENGNITNSIIEKVCSRSTESSVYNVSKAVLRGDLQDAYTILDDLFFMNTDAAYILTILASAYIDIYRAFAARSAGMRPENVAKDLGYYNTAFRLTDADRKLSRLSEKQIVASLKLLSECDKKIKSSRCDGRTLIEKALVELTLIAKEKQ